MRFTLGLLNELPFTPVVLQGKGLHKTALCPRPGRENEGRACVSANWTAINSETEPPSLRAAGQAPDPKGQEVPWGPRLAGPGMGTTTLQTDTGSSAGYSTFQRWQESLSMGVGGGVCSLSQRDRVGNGLKRDLNSLLRN